jgi:hypothetical protein
VYDVYSLRVLGAYYKGNSHLEEGIVAELDGKPAPSRFRASLKEFEALANHMAVLETKLTELVEIDDKAAGLKNQVYEATVTKILTEAKPPFERLTTSGVRFSDIAAGAPDKSLAIRSGHDILVAQRDDLRILRQKLVEVIDAYRNAMPLTEKGEFVRVMLSGRNAFGSKMPQFTEMMSAYDRFIVRSCMTTIDATMQVYPVGWEWLQPRK